MAEKKSSSKKASSSKKSSKPAAAPKPKAKAPEKPSYEEVLAARKAMEAAHSHVAVVSRRLRAARTDMSDFKLRDQKVAAVQEELAQARADAVAAVKKFTELRGN